MASVNVEGFHHEERQGVLRVYKGYSLTGLIGTFASLADDGPKILIITILYSSPFKAGRKTAFILGPAQGSVS